MNARINGVPSGYVTVADAAKELGRRGDTIDASNISRYLARNPDIATIKIGKYRYVDLAALILHRGGNLQSITKRDSAVQPAPVAVPVDDTSGEGAASQGSGISRAIQEANLRLKELQVRDAERDEKIALGELVPAAEVISIVTTVAQVLIAEFERGEISIAAKHGRSVSADFRKIRKDAQTRAAERLAQLAQAQLHPSVARPLTETPTFTAE
ncbi:hypothetical protein [Brevundimonas sp.]|uniref:hypothetical protein n=1 Tax=Brevundimonas sp. TaxID=1871086 RepID=UPI00289F40BD|nr:hypothetical protein [Brevundimonas sp.]